MYPLLIVLIILLALEVNTFLKNKKLLSELKEAEHMRKGHDIIKYNEPIRDVAA